MAKSYYKSSRYRTSSSQSQTMWVFFISILFIFGFFYSMKKPSNENLPLIPTAEFTDQQLIENTKLYTPHFEIN